MPNLYAKPILPAAFKPDAIRTALLAEMRHIGEEVKADFQATVATWDDKPAFESQISLTNAGGPILFAGLKNDGSEAAQHYHFVNDGTRPHDILPGAATGKSNKRALRFPGTFSPKTLPGVLGSSAGGSSGERVFARGVHHPGTKARRFDQAITRRWQPRYAARMAAAMARGAKASGHAP